MIWLEVARGAWLSEARPLLVVDDWGVMEEVRGLERVSAHHPAGAARPSGSKAMMGQHEAGAAAAAAAAALTEAGSGINSSSSGAVERVGAAERVLSQEGVDAVVADLGMVRQVKVCHACLSHNEVAPMVRATIQMSHFWLMFVCWHSQECCKRACSSSNVSSSSACRAYKKSALLAFHACCAVLALRTLPQVSAHEAQEHV